MKPSLGQVRQYYLLNPNPEWVWEMAQWSLQMDCLCSCGKDSCGYFVSLVLNTEQRVETCPHWERKYNDRVAPPEVKLR